LGVRLRRSESPSFARSVTSCCRIAASAAPSLHCLDLIAQFLDLPLVQRLVDAHDLRLDAAARDEDIRRIVEELPGQHHLHRRALLSAGGVDIPGARRVLQRLLPEHCRR
jgi:hypothetical protein